MQWLSCRLLSPWHKKLPLQQPLPNRPLLLKPLRLQKPSLQQHLPLKPKLLQKLPLLLPKALLLQNNLLPNLLFRPKSSSLSLNLFLSRHKNPPLLPPQKPRSLQNLNRLPPPLPTLRVRRVLPKACAWARPKRPLPSFTEALTILS